MRTIYQPIHKVAKVVFGAIHCNFLYSTGKTDEYISKEKSVEMQKSPVLCKIK